MHFESYHPLLLLDYFAAVIAMAVGFDHPCCVAVAYGGAFLCSAALGRRRALWFDLALIPLGAAFVLFYASYRHFGVTVLAMNIHGNRITLESLVYGAVLAGKMAAVLMWLSCVLSVISDDKLVYLFGRVAPRLAMALAVILRAVPRAAARWRSVALAQYGLGRSGRQGNIAQRAKHFFQTLSIVITWTLEDFVESAASMKSRGSGLRGRTAFALYPFDGRDRALALGLTALITVQLMGHALGQTAAVYDPVIVINRVTPMSGVFYAAYAFLALVPWLSECIGAARWRRRVEKRV